TYQGFTGRHACQVDYAVGWFVNNEECSESGSTVQKTLIGRFWAAPFQPWLGHTITLEMYVHRNGNAWGENVSSD
ncbi:hypothetical protein, partial [Arcanobacterium bovis]|uniref:hypothetical protein n=1 Tax=Arcanobacterium bovis TaxID=2529275 RepID=UPI0019D5B23B